MLYRRLEFGSSVVKASQVENSIQPQPLVSANLLELLGYCGKSWYDCHISPERAQTLVS